MQIVSACKILCQSLTPSPADYEALRLYMMLPEIVIYEPPRNEIGFVANYGERIYRLQNHAKLALCELMLYIYLLIDYCSF